MIKTRDLNPNEFIVLVLLVAWWVTILFFMLTQSKIEDATAKKSQGDIQCLTTALWHEARGEPIKGIHAVANVISNRSLDRKARGLPWGYCDIIQEKGQFSFITPKNPLRIIQKDNLGLLEEGIHAKLSEIASKQYRGELAQVVPKEVLWYTHKEIRQDWLMKKQKVTTIGSHSFYR